MSRARLIALIAFLVVVFVSAIAFFASVSLPPVDSLTRTRPRQTSLMRARADEARRKGRRAVIDQRWVAYDHISPLLRRAVLIAEDDAFFSHDGLDWNELKSAARTNWKRGRIVRGGSTITQQLAKNLYLGQERSIIRKAREMLIARRLEETLSKRRIFELYLNLIEWGDGIYGAEAAARRHFGVSASNLSPRQAALLASVIINPRRFSPVQPTRRIERRMKKILGRMWRRGFLSESEYRVALGEAPPPSSPFDWLFGGGDPTPTPEAAPPPDTTWEEEGPLEEPATVDTLAVDTLPP
ncbi:MAG TPA: monofunctional biosynthetic peptidoglycan transglycosylase [Candidatus Eisenbacteria bacterium]|nr:monofunctional biosynthetic peptidoglycan transglycosylase [Candidatus Eisenbacteria bacterium]